MYVFDHVYMFAYDVYMYVYMLVCMYKLSTCIWEVSSEVVDAHPGEGALLLSAQDAAVERVVHERVPALILQDPADVIHDGVRVRLQQQPHSYNKNLRNFRLKDYNQL